MIRSSTKRNPVCFLLLADFLSEGLVISPANLCNVHGGFREFDAEIFHRVNNDLRDGEITEPLMVGWDHKPRRVARAASAEGVLIRALVACPVFSFGIVCLTDLPAARW